MQSSPLPAHGTDLYVDPPAAEGIAVPAKASGKSFSLGRVIQQHRLEVAGALIILIAGLALRLLPFFGVPDQLTLDENLYITNVKMVKMVGPFEYSALVQTYVERQAKMDMVMLPPTRCVYIMLGWAWDSVFHSGPRMSLRYVAAIFSVLSFLLSGLFAFRLGGTRLGLTVAALMAVAPLELVMAHRELVDGVFAFWALLSLWLLWENMQRPGRLGWLAAYAGSIAVMVLTKENAFFATVAMGGILGTAALAPRLNLGSLEHGSGDLCRRRARRGCPRLPGRKSADFDRDLHPPGGEGGENDICLSERRRPMVPVHHRPDAGEPVGVAAGHRGNLRPSAG